MKKWDVFVGIVMANDEEGEGCWHTLRYVVEAKTSKAAYRIAKEKAWLDHSKDSLAVFEFSTCPHEESEEEKESKRKSNDDFFMDFPF